MPNDCCICPCKERRSCYRFPKNTQRRKEWTSFVAKCINRHYFVPNRLSRICSKHFAATDIERKSVKLNDGRVSKNYLVATAVPTIFDGQTANKIAATKSPSRLNASVENNLAVGVPGTTGPALKTYQRVRKRDTNSQDKDASGSLCKKEDLKKLIQLSKQSRMAALNTYRSNRNQNSESTSSGVPASAQDKVDNESLSKTKNIKLIKLCKQPQIATLETADVSFVERFEDPLAIGIRDDAKTYQRSNDAPPCNSNGQTNSFSPLREKVRCNNESNHADDGSINKLEHEQLYNFGRQSLAALKAQHAKEKADLTKKLSDYKQKIQHLLLYNREQDANLKLAEAKINQLQQDLVLSEKIMENNGIIFTVEDGTKGSNETNSGHYDDCEMESLEWRP